MVVRVYRVVVGEVDQDDVGDIQRAIAAAGFDALSELELKDYARLVDLEASQ